MCVVKRLYWFSEVSFMRFVGKSLIVFALAFSVAASAASSTSPSTKDKRNRYKWTDEQGNLHYDDALPVEALQFGYDVVNNQGIVVKHVDRAKTTDELKADKEASDKAAVAKRVSDAQARNEQQLLAAYPNENDLVIAQHAQIDTIDQSVHATEASLKNQEKSLSEMLSHAADLDRTGKPVPTVLQQQIDSLRVNVEKQKTYIANKEAEKEADEKKFETDLAHYRDVQARHAHR
jgi:hypothetical protein